MAGLIDSTRSILLLVDFQIRLMPAILGGDAVVETAVRLGKAAHLLGVPITLTEQKPEKLGVTVKPLSGFARSPVIKATFDATQDATFAAAMPKDRRDIVIAGCEAHICVLQTALGLLSAGHRVFVVRDAIGSRRTESVDAALARLASNGAEIVTAEMMLFEWLGTADHPQFRAVSALIK